MRRTRKKKYIGIVLLMLIIYFIIIVFLFVDNNIKNMVTTMSEERARYIAIKAMNNSIKITLGNNLKYTDLINVLTDKDGKIAMIQANTIRMNTLASEASSAAQEEIRSMGQEILNIPLGSILGIRILAGWGPNLKVKIVPVGSVSTDFATEFENAGINQTRHKIFLTMQSQVKIVAPLGGETIKVSTRMPITETIIVGEVPYSYVNVDEKDKMLNLIPKN